MVSLEEIFHLINREHFDEFLDLPQLKWNSRLRASAGRFFPGSRQTPVSQSVFSWFSHGDHIKSKSGRQPLIEVASYLLEEPRADALIRDTVAHEMIHYWLWVRRKPYGHTPEFTQKMKAMGVSRYNTVPRLRPPKYTYRCPSCGGAFPARKRLGNLACMKCCKEHAGGKFDARFKLQLEATREGK